MSDPVNLSTAVTELQASIPSGGALEHGGTAIGNLNAEGVVRAAPNVGLADDTVAVIPSGGFIDTLTRFPVIEQIDRAGVVGWVLGAMALIGLVVFFYKLVGFLRRGVFADGFVKDVERHLSSGDETQAADLLTRRRHPAARIGLSGMSLSVGNAQDRAAASDLISARARKEIDDLNGGLRIMSAIAVLSPLLGLLGTVMGMIEAFQRMEGAGSRIDPSVLSGGIWLALLTTAIGLVVAIPATAFHMWMLSVIGRVTAVMEDVCTLVVNRDELANTPAPRASNITDLRPAAE